MPIDSPRAQAERLFQSAKRLVLQDRYDTAILVLNQAIQYSPTAQLYDYRGVVLSLALQNEGALESFTMALSLATTDAERAEIYFHRGLLYGQDQLYEEALFPNDDLVPTSPSNTSDYHLFKQASGIVPFACFPFKKGFVLMTHDLPQEELRLLPLTALSLYFREINDIALLSHEREKELALRARAGDEAAKCELIESCMHYVAKVAETFYQTMPRGRDEYLDLVSVGHLALVERFDRALQTENPSAYLRGIAKQHIWAHCVYSSWLITLPERKNYIGQSPDVCSLNAHVGNTDQIYQDIVAAQTDVVTERPSEFFEALHRGIESALTPTEREIVVRYYGLYGSTAHTTHEISYALSGNPNSNFAAGLRLRAVAKLRAFLEEQAA
jgi:hypothetical protein